MSGGQWWDTPILGRKARAAEPEVAVRVGPVIWQTDEPQATAAGVRPEEPPVTDGPPAGPASAGETDPLPATPDLRRLWVGRILAGGVVLLVGMGLGLVAGRLLWAPQAGPATGSSTPAGPVGSTSSSPDELAVALHASYRYLARQAAEAPTPDAAQLAFEAYARTSTRFTDGLVQSYPAVSAAMTADGLAAMQTLFFDPLRAQAITLDGCATSVLTTRIAAAGLGEAPGPLVEAARRACGSGRADTAIASELLACAAALSDTLAVQQAGRLSAGQIAARAGQVRLNGSGQCPRPESFNLAPAPSTPAKATTP